MTKTTLTIGEDELNEILVDSVGLSIDELRDRDVFRRTNAVSTGPPPTRS